MFVEPLVTRARKNDDYAKRLIARVIYDKTVIETLFTEVAPRYIGRSGGYTRITKLGPRQGDGAEEAVIEFVPVEDQKETKDDSK